MSTLTWRDEDGDVGILDAAAELKELPAAPGAVGLLSIGRSEDDPECSVWVDTGTARKLIDWLEFRLQAHAL